jgi:hypothetical protein
MFSTDKTVLVFFETCVAIDQGKCGGIGYGCGSLAWERAHMSNDKYMYRRDNSWLYDDVGCRFLLLSLLELCFMGYMGKDKICSLPSQGDSCPKLHSWYL